MYTCLYKNLKFDSIDQKAIEDYFEKHSSSWKTTQIMDNFTLSYLVLWKFPAEAVNFYNWAVRRGVDYLGFTKEESEKYHQNLIWIQGKIDNE